MVRLYADENFPLPVLEERRRWGHDGLTIVGAPTDSIEPGGALWYDQPETRQLDPFGERGVAAMRSGERQMSDGVRARESEEWAPPAPPPATGRRWQMPCAEEPEAGSSRLALTIV